MKTCTIFLESWHRISYMNFYHIQSIECQRSANKSLKYVGKLSNLLWLQKQLNFIFRYIQIQLDIMMQFYKVFFWRCLVLNLEPCAWWLNSLPQIKYKPVFFKIWRKRSGSHYESKRQVDRLMEERIHRQWHSSSLWKEKARQWILTNKEIKQTKELGFENL